MPGFYIERLELRSSNLMNGFLDKIISPDDYREMKARSDKELVLLKDKLTDLQQPTSPFKVYIQKEEPMLENLLEYYRKSDGATQKKIPGCIIAEKLFVKHRAQGAEFRVRIRVNVRK
jgi:hypothetical protein